ncbi:MAG TPA: hypothetical protein VKO67_11710 [Smithellaceae bacterium]|nr:hypothetical protein [Smithellaceae bacterium]
MHEFLHIRTLIFVSGITSLILFVCMLYIWKHQKTYPGFLRWTFSSLLNAAGMLLVSYRGILPDFITIIISDILLMAAMMLITSGFSLFARQKPRERLHIGILLIYSVIMLFLTYGWPDFNLRVIVYSMIQAALCIANAWILYKHVPGVLPNREVLYSWFFAVCAVIPILRAIASSLDASGATEMMAAGVYHQMAVLIGLNFYIIVDIGLIILTAQRIDYELNKAKDEIKTITGLIPICSNCKKIRDDKGSWTLLESYFADHTDIMFSHGLCPDCVKELYPDIKLE